MLEKAIAKFNIDPKQSWLVGDHCRDIQSGKKMGLKTVLVTIHENNECHPELKSSSLLEAINNIL